MESGSLFFLLKINEILEFKIFRMRKIKYSLFFEFKKNILWFVLRKNEEKNWKKKKPHMCCIEACMHSSPNSFNVKGK